MKKYLMSGIAAIALCAAFTSCSKGDLYDEDQINQNAIAKAEQDYAAAFEKAFGKVGANVDWGFGPSRANTRTWNVNGNQWHNELNLEYDAPVTTAEKNLVFNYVNNKNNVETVEQITLSKYWVAQIWNGNTDQNADGVKAPVSHSYPNQTGAITDIIGGAQMDKLEILEKAGTWTHCNNFNHADNNDWIEPENGGVEGRTLMEESGTLSFRYTNSQSSYLSEKYIIVPGEKIDASLKGRYYVCFDFEKGYTDAEKAEEKTFFSFIAKDNNGALQAEQTVSLPGYYTSANMPTDQQILDAFGNPNYKEISSISIKGYLYGDKHCDGDDNYTDWIVRISPAKVKESSEHNYRVIAEDLSANEASDFDFNDVVFDVIPNEAKTAAEIVLRACGGIYKLTVGDANHEVHEAFGQNADPTTGLYPMINTNPWNPNYKVTLFEAYPGDFSDANIRSTINGIEIRVYKPNTGEAGALLTARTGQAACKILVDDTFSVVTERHGIADANNNFHMYVQGYWDTETQGWWWREGSAQ